jgi:hypothetical protein
MTSFFVVCLKSLKSLDSSTKFNIPDKISYPDIFFDDWQNNNSGGDRWKSKMISHFAS